MMRKITQKEIISRVEDFIKNNAIPYDEISISIIIEGPSAVSTEYKKEANFYGRLEEDEH